MGAFQGLSRMNLPGFKNKTFKALNAGFVAEKFDERMFGPSTEDIAKEEAKKENRKKKSLLSSGPSKFVGGSLHGQVVGKGTGTSGRGSLLT